MPGVPDDDVAQAFVAKWNADTTLVSLVPGGLEQGRLSSFQPNAAPTGEEKLPPERKRPYATFQVKQGPVPNEEDTGGDFIDHRQVDLEIRGLRKDVAAALGRARSTELYIRNTSWDVPNVVRFMGCLEIPGDDLSKDDTGGTKDGEETWVGRLSLHVMNHRRY